MNMSETKPEFQAVADDMQALLIARVASAEPIEVLSRRDDKLLQVVEETDGRRFVTRSYTNDGVKDVEEFDLDFYEAWNAMHEVFRTSGLNVLPSFLLKTEGQYPITVVSEYLPNSKPVIGASLETKIDIAKGMGNIIKPSSKCRLGLDMLNRDMFRVVDNEDGTETAYLVDVDPRMRVSDDFAKDLYQAIFIDKLAGLIWDHWSDNDDERASIATAAVKSVVEALGDEAFLPNTHTGNSFFTLHFMSNGLDTRNMSRLNS